MKLKKQSFLSKTFYGFLNEQINNKLVLYKGIEEEWLKPNSNPYSFFSESKKFAIDYGNYIWKCTFEPLNLFVSYDTKSIIELYDSGFKLRDTYIEFNWDGLDDYIYDLYDYDLNTNPDVWGYKSANSLINSPYFGSDTWEMIENTNNVLDYILSKYDGVILLEGGEKTYYIRTDKIIYCNLEK